MKLKHVIIDGSNIATEGRDTPSLAQLDEAVQAFVEEYSPTHVTVVVDATFPNRIDRKERQTYEDAVNANELITPPAGRDRPRRRLRPADRSARRAAILSNDSFQEFHGDYPWLFERGRLFGGKPVPHVGWVFMERTPSRGRPAAGPSARPARWPRPPRRGRRRGRGRRGGGGSGRAGRRRARREAGPPAAGPRLRRRRLRWPRPRSSAAVAAEPDGAGDTGRGLEPYNEALPFIDFVGRHPVGSEVEATIERFSSHGAYVLVGEARAYVPLRNLAHPAPRSAKGILRVGETRRFVVWRSTRPGAASTWRPRCGRGPGRTPAGPEEQAAPTETDITDAAAAEAAAPARKSRSGRRRPRRSRPVWPSPRLGRLRPASRGPARRRPRRSSRPRRPRLRLAGPGPGRRRPRRLQPSPRPRGSGSQVPVPQGDGQGGRAGAGGGGGSGAHVPVPEGDGQGAPPSRPRPAASRRRLRCGSPGPQRDREGRRQGAGTGGGGSGAQVPDPQRDR
jgi:hypothetical protein